LYKEAFISTVDIVREKGVLSLSGVGTFNLIHGFSPVVERVLGVKVSKEKVWELYKEAFISTVDIVREKGVLSLSGVGTFTLREGTGRKTSLNKDSFVEGKKVKRFRFKPSVSLMARVRGELEENLPKKVAQI